MTISFNDFNAAAQLTGESLLQELNRSILKTASGRKTTQSRYGNWRASTTGNASSGETPGGMVFETLMMSLLMQTLFGLPMFQGFGFSNDTVQGLAALGSGLHHSAASDGPREMFDGPSISQSLMNSQRTRFQNASRAQDARVDQLQDMKKHILLILTWLMLQEEKGDSGEGEAIAPDILRHPKLARFKQNRHSMECIRTLFKNQAAVVTPVFGAPRPW